MQIATINSRKCSYRIERQIVIINIKNTIWKLEYDTSPRGTIITTGTKTQSGVDFY